MKKGTREKVNLTIIESFLSLKVNRTWFKVDESCSDMARNAAEAVSALHKTMVILREELARKNEKIEQLQSKLVFNESSETTEDPVLEFNLSDEDEDQENPEGKLDSLEISDVKEHVLFIKKDIDLHWPPLYLKSTCSVSPIRPILKPPSNTSRYCTGSQTDISALSPGAMSTSSDQGRTSSAEPKASENETLLDGRNWGSEPSLMHEQRETTDESSNLTKKTIYSSSHSYSRGAKKLVIQRKEKIEGGRYTILNQNFEPLCIDIESAEIKKANIDWDAFEKLKEFSIQHDFSVQTSLSSSGSTSSLIDEANHFLDIAKEKFLTVDDWTDIHNRKSARKKSTRERSSSLPYVPFSISDLEDNDKVRFIGKSAKLTEGKVLNTDQGNVQILTNSEETVLVPFEKIVMAWKKHDDQEL